MAITAALVYRGTLSTTTTTTLYTASANTIVTNIALTNTTSSAATATINLAGTALLSAVTVPANSTAFFDLKQYVASGQTVTGGAGTASAINAHISGVTGV
jgi:hypothetical protein